MNKQLLDLHEKLINGYRGRRGGNYVSDDIVSELHKNPTQSELKSFGIYNRGIILKNGDLYIVHQYNINTGKTISTAEAIITHSDIISMMMTEIIIQKNIDAHFFHYNPSVMDHFLCVHRLKDTMNFYISESYLMTKNSMKNKLNEVFDEYKNAVQEKNPHIKLHSKSVMDTDYYNE